MPVKKKRPTLKPKKETPKEEAAPPVPSAPKIKTPPVIQATVPVPAGEPKTEPADENLLDSAPIINSTENQAANNQAETPPSDKDLLFEDKKDSDDETNWKKVFLFFGITIVISGIIGAASFLAYQRGIQVGKQNAQEALTAKLTTAPVPNTPTPTEEAEVDLSEFSIKILNGSGTSGEASKLQSTLEEEGYTVSSIGNATEDYTKTTIQAKEKVSKAWLNKLKKSLSQTYILAETSTLEDADDDVVINIGNLKNE